MKIIDRIRTWFQYKADPTPLHAPISEMPAPAAPPLETGIRVQMQEIGPDAFITNTSKTGVMLEGTLIKRIYIPSGSTVRVVSPVLERVYDFVSHSTKLQEWDAMKVAENMVNEYARGVAYDELTPQECREVTFPVPDRMLGRILQRIGLRVHY